MASGQGISLTVLVARSVSDCKLKASEEQGPTSLTRVQVFGTLNIFQVFVICDDLKRMNCPLQPISPLFNGCLHG